MGMLETLLVIIMAEVRRRVTYGQLEQLWEFLQKNKAIATGYNKTSQAREYSRKMWENIAVNLNSHGDGAIKDWKGWCKYWNDYKSKLKKLAAATKASHRQTGGGPSQIKPMTDIEKKFLQILGEDFGTGLPGIRVEPFEQDSQETESGGVQIVLEVDLGPEHALTGSPVQPLEDQEPLPGPSNRVTPPPPELPPTVEPPPPELTPPTVEPATTGAPAPQSTPRRSPRRRRRTRREPVMSQDAARRALIHISERRAEIEERNSQILQDLLNEIKEIKEILRLRSNGHPRDGE